MVQGHSGPCWQTKVLIQWTCKNSTCPSSTAGKKQTKQTQTPLNQMGHVGQRCWREVPIGQEVAERWLELMSMWLEIEELVEILVGGWVFHQKIKIDLVCVEGPQRGHRGGVMAAADPGFWSGGQQSFDPKGAWAQTLLKIGVFP